MKSKTIQYTKHELNTIATTHTLNGTHASAILIREDEAYNIFIKDNYQESRTAALDHAHYINANVVLRGMTLDSSWKQGEAMTKLQLRESGFAI